jgi:DNA helicase II / ATP-dependent DNA helicase PcrA
MDQRLINDEKFIEAFNKLNAEQKHAVEQIEGPVMVIAGPGTGKTELLSLRVCNILRLTDAGAKNILCLTYTDSGVTAMRSRLVKYMGAEAYNINIHTFHSFCARVINENPALFNEFRELTIADELDIIEVMSLMMDELDVAHPIKRNTGDRYHDITGFKYVFGVMKRENWSADFIAKAINDYPEYLANLPEFQFKKDGSPNPRLVKIELDKVDFVKHAAPLIDNYNSLMKSRGLIDFDDAISMVVQKLTENDDLRASYQEQFLYILADEYQDTNGSQNEILFQLSTHFQEPNLFVVGDDDQAIYRFQGASSSNIIAFMERFNPQVFVLKNNYRSHQQILDASSQLISRNSDRLINRIPDLDKRLVQSADITNLDSNFPRAIYYQNDYCQAIGLIEEIKALYDRGIPYNDIAVIYKKHDHAKDILSYFATKGLPYKVKKKVNLLDQNLIKKTITLLKYVVGESKVMDSKVDLLFEILHYDFFKLKPIDVGSFTLKSRSEINVEKKSWRQIFFDEALLAEMKLSEPEKFIAINSILESCILACQNETPQVCFQTIINKTGLLDYVLRGSDVSWHIQMINKLFDYIKKVTSFDPEMTMENILLNLDRMDENNIPIPIVNVTSNPDGVHFMTAHGAKGLEFRYVYILNTNESGWSLKPIPQKKFPINLTLSNSADTEEEARRLMFVALTRAKEQVTLMVPRANNDEKPSAPHKFLTEIGIEVDFENSKTVDEKILLDYTGTLLTLNAKKPELIDKNLLQHVISKLKLNTTSVSKYLNCQIKFYFENILQVPGARLATTGYGNAIHNALETLAIEFEKDPLRKVPDVKILIDAFDRSMLRFKSHFNKEEYASYLYEGKKYLEQGFAELTNRWESTARIKPEYKVSANLDDIPLTGNIDRIDIYNDHIEIFDYKTGKFDTGKPKFKTIKDDQKVGGDYWRQGVFYKIILDLENKFPKTPDSTYAIYFKSDKEEYAQKTIKITSEDYEIVQEQIRDVYAGIKNHEFSKGCNDCKWCKFVNETMHLDLNDVVLDEDEDPEGFVINEEVFD